MIKICRTPEISGESLVDGSPRRGIAFLSDDFFSGGRPDLLQQILKLKDCNNFIHFTRTLFQSQRKEKKNNTFHSFQKQASYF